MKCIHKKWLRRYLAVIILFCLLLQSMHSTITATDNSSISSTKEMHFIVRHWHADGSSEDIEGYLREDGSWELKNDGKVAEVIPAANGNPVAVKLSVKPKENETFTGFATAAGHEAVGRERDEEQPNKSYLMISYNQDIHLAKVHVFYKDTLQEKNGANLGANETEIREDEKFYNTSQEGLHTDKTVSEAAGSNDGRTFDLTLESWFVGNNQANVGMVLDASGSMAFTSNDLEPIRMTTEQINKYGILQYIPQQEVNEILNPLYTDNSKLGYSGYTYFVYDPSKDTKEYVPIGYWNGVVKDITQQKVTLPQQDKLVGYYPFDEPSEQINEADRIKGGEADSSKKVLIVDIPTDDGKLEEAHSGKPPISRGAAYIKKGLDLARGYRENKNLPSAVQLDIKPENDSFTISFAVQGSSERPLLWIGNPDQSGEKAWYAIYADTAKRQTRVVSGKDITTSDTGRFVEGNLSKSSINICTYVFEIKDDNNTKVTIYADGQQIAQDFVDGGIISEDSVIILGGSAWANDYGGNPLWDSEDERYLVDELYIYNEALTAEEVEELYGAMQNPAIEPAFAATMPSDKNKTMAELKNADTEGNGAGWYCVSSSSVWSQITGEQLLTSKSYRGIPKDEVIYNRIDEVPEGTKEPYIGNTQEYIYTGDINFQGNEGDTPAIGIASEWNGSIIFYIDKEGYLRCFFNGGTSQKRNDNEDTLDVDSSNWTANGSYCSYVYKKSDLQRIKTEALQYALGSFVTHLGEVSPDSQVSAVRFGTQNLVVDGDENTSNENLKTLVLLDWTKNTMDSTGMLGLRRGEDRTADGCEESENGIMQYNYILTGGTSTWTGLQSYVDNLKERDGGDSTVSRHLIIFTDGKDTTGTEGALKSVAIADALKAEGYTIYCVMLQSAGNRLVDSMEFLESLASAPEYVFAANDVETLTEVFTTKILDNLVGSLSDYTVQDYIDPRFNLVTADGTVIYLNNGGNIIAAGKSIHLDGTQGYEVTVMEAENNRGETGEKAMLYYDGEKEMYYLQWQNQTIPACGVGAARLDVWKTKITVRAKDDFLGGNAIFTNGNETDMNKVFDSENEGHPSKSFPVTAANVELLKLTMEDELETIYKGQTISPERLRNILGEKVENNAYYEYLERYLNNIEQEEYDKITSALASGSEVEIPYMYLPDNTGTNQTGKEHKNDRIGTLKYQWQACEDNGLGGLVPKTENPEYDDFVTDDTNSRYYRLTITYEPWSEEERKEENNRLISNAEYSKPYYWAGRTQNEIKASCVHQTDIVSGELVVEARVLLSDLLDMAGKNNGLLDMEESFTAVRTYNGEESTIKLKLTFHYTTEELLKLLPKADGDGYISIYSKPFTELPIGEYRISADNVTALEFGGISKREILDENGHFSEKYSKEGKESLYAANAMQEDNTNVIIFYLGIQGTKDEAQEDSSVNLNARLGHVVISYSPDKDIPVIDTVSVIVDGVKHLSGRTLKQGEFVFELLDETGRILRETTNEADGSFCFDKLTFDKEGIYTYILRERENSINGITYDKKYYLVQIQVEKQEGRLTAMLIYKRGEKEQVEKAEFFNKYENNEILPDDSPSKTGDMANIFILRLIMCISILLVLVAVFIRRKDSISKQKR